MAVIMTISTAINETSNTWIEYTAVAHFPGLSQHNYWYLHKQYVRGHAIAVDMTVDRFTIHLAGQASATHNSLTLPKSTNQVTTRIENSS